jgi:hypothetical protein
MLFFNQHNLVPFFLINKNPQGEKKKKKKNQKQKLELELYIREEIYSVADLLFLAMVMIHLYQYGTIDILCI